MGNFEDLKVWQLSKNLAVEVYAEIEKTEKLKRDFGLKDQLARSAVSIPSNIAEGDELNTVKQGLRHLYIAKGSCEELITQLIICKEIGKMNPERAAELIAKAKHISSSLYKLIEARKKWLT